MTHAYQSKDTPLVTPNEHGWPPAPITGRVHAFHDGQVWLSIQASNAYLTVPMPAASARKLAELLVKGADASEVKPRMELVDRVRAEIAEGRYVSEQKLDVTTDRLLEELRSEPTA